MPTKPRRSLRGKTERKAVKKSLSLTPAAWRVIESRAEAEAKRRGTVPNVSETVSNLVLAASAILSTKHPK